MSSLEEVSVRNMIGVVNHVSNFSLLIANDRKLKEATESTQPESSVQKLKDLCQTWWIERIDVA